MLKRDIRISFLERRSRLTTADVETLEESIACRFRESQIPLPAAIHRFMPARDRCEPDPTPLVAWLRSRNPGLREMVPRIIPGTDRLESIFVRSDTLWRFDTWGIPEPVEGASASPSEADLVFVPLLAFDKSGHRVGYGKGFYDRFLTECRIDCIRIGLSWFGPVDAIDDLRPEDVPLHLCITPERIYAFPQL
ncbi:MAG: 5-formyltetrahydrofolate cyclo-ligase [Chitinophagia bacterium]|nr:5-formyltetrahydrofolate cyclo-ligase [Chitinophagia bacterium]